MGLEKFLDKNGVLFLWGKIKAAFATKDSATSTENGLMSSADKVKLDGIATGANKYVHPSYTPKESGLYKITVTKKVWRVLSQRRHHTDRCGQRVGDAVG